MNVQSVGMYHLLSAVDKYFLLLAATVMKVLFERNLDLQIKKKPFVSVNNGKIGKFYVNPWATTVGLTNWLMVKYRLCS